MWVVSDFTTSTCEAKVAPQTMASQGTIKSYASTKFNSKTHKKAFMRVCPIVYNGNQTGNNEVQYCANFAEKDALEALLDKDKVRLMSKRSWTGEYNRMRLITEKHVHIIFALAKTLPLTGSELGNEPDVKDALPFVNKTIPIITTTHEGKEVIFLTDTYVLQEHLEGGLGFSYVLDVNGIKGHVKDKAAVDMTAVHALLDKFGFAYEEYEDAD